MGGADAVLEKAKASFDQGDFRWVAEVVNHVVFADPDNQAAKDLQADALEQLGYQAESGPWRNFYLTGAKELRDGVAQLPTPNTASPDTVRAMTLDLFFDYLGVRLNAREGRRCDDEAQLRLRRPGRNLSAPAGERRPEPHGRAARPDDADATITLSRDTLNNVMLQQRQLDDAVSPGDVKIDGDHAKLDGLVSYLDTFEFWFNIVTP